MFNEPISPAYCVVGTRENEVSESQPWTTQGIQTDRMSSIASAAVPQPATVPAPVVQVLQAQAAVLPFHIVIYNAE